MTVTAKALASRFDVPIADVRAVLRSLHGPLPRGSAGWELDETQILEVLEAVPNRPPRVFAERSTTELLGQYAQTLAELRVRGVVRTGNAPLGDYAEHLALNVYGGSLAPNSAKSYDLTAPDARRIQVKARTVSASTSPSAVFSVFRSFDFDVATLLVLESRTYDLKWARELSPDQVRGASRWSAHVRGHLLPIRAAAKIGTDVTHLFNRA